jgi:hypothetical protein|tara:strand:+ start:827 stop:1027 length:201 start_codon:yes stop_codon:yes gene_type:complete
MIKLTADTLDNFTNSAVINIGKNNGYIEAYIDNAMESPQLCIYIYDSKGNVFSREIMPVELLKRGK